MTPYEILLSESQERMLICAKKDRVGEVQAIFAKWDLDAVVIGYVTEGGRLRARFHGEVVVDIPVDAVVNLCPIYRRPVKAPAFLRTISKLPELPVPEDLAGAFLETIASPPSRTRNGSSASTIICPDQYGLLPGADAAVLRIRGATGAGRT
jgi:phosphoribosylformylglycinamidine synthase